MIPLVDTHCHILAGLDDGARDDDEAIRMCEMAYRDGVQVIAATAHQSGSYPENTAQKIAAATVRLAEQLRKERIPITVYACGEVALSDTLIRDWEAGQIQSLGQATYNVLLEYPNGYPGDFLSAAQALLRAGIRPIVAHAERYSTLLKSPELMERLVRTGCLIQVSTAALEADRRGEVHRTVKGWFRGNLVHMIGSDAHDSFRRRPGLSTAYSTIAGWTDQQSADRICGFQALTVLRGGRFRPVLQERRQSKLKSFWQRLSGRRRLPVHFSVPRVDKAKLGR